ncbi:amino acid permease [Pseudoclavibacter chungangensis]|uniref:Amino acid permease n=1 Tax=Pseudoclavibacter chungangensis TaxID=587635 RepID=A0A7J5BZS9_9MICO|nr:APC family permease [Pseudoclavibacter chungangensis]KAB1659665.1 amino acid permease [Pseudoclavibacter chungangensis]NYJ67503.1 amino acid transporter [Pseudoclavibacter chungangensis]
MSTEKPETGTESAPQLRRVLGVPSLVLFGLVYMVPLTVFTTYGIVTQLTGGRVAGAYLVTLVVMLFTARSYARMAAAYPSAGSAYVYTQRTLGPEVGFIAGWSLMLDYLFLPMINYLVIGIYLHAALPAVPQWVFVLASIVVVTVLNIVGIVSVNRTNSILLAVQAVFVVVFAALVFGSISGGTVDPVAPFVGDGSVEGPGPLFAGAAILCLSFLGFDAVSTLAEEAKEPTKNVPRAIMIVTFGAGVMFVVLSWLAQAVHPSTSFADPDSASVEVMMSAGGQFLATFFTAAYCAGALGSAITSQASVSRILYSMGRDGVLPRPVFGHLHERFKSPARATLIVSVVSLTALIAPLDVVASMVSFGALIAFSFVNIAVLKHYFIDRKERSGIAVLNNLVLPVIGFGLTLWLWTSLSGLTFVIGLSWAALGFILLLVVTRGFRRRAPMLALDEH